MKKLIASNGSISLPSTGYSMYPAIRPRDECLFIPVNEKDVKPGDILLFCDHEGSLVGHRLVSVAYSRSGMTYTCKGDTNLYPDRPVAFDRIVGKLASIERTSSRSRKSRISSTGRGMAIWGSAILRFPILCKGLRRWIAYTRDRAK